MSLQTKHNEGTIPFKQVGFYGCNDTIVRVRPRPGSLRKGTTAHTARPCPACGRPHSIKVMWRRLNKRERLRHDITV